MVSRYPDRVWKQKLCGSTEIAEFAKVTRAQVSHWFKEDWFPRTVDELRMGRVWDYQEVVDVLTQREYPRDEDFYRRTIDRILRLTPENGRIL